MSEIIVGDVKKRITYKCEHSGCDQDAVWGVNYSLFDTVYSCEEDRIAVIESAPRGVFCYRLEAKKERHDYSSVVARKENNEGDDDHRYSCHKSSAINEHVR